MFHHHRPEESGIYNASTASVTRTEPSFPFISSSGGMTGGAVSWRFPFTSAQWQELERQTTIFKYLMASVPVPPELLIPITKTSSISIKRCTDLGFSNLSRNSSADTEPWRCRRTDGKKWRCSRDAAPDQKYCERHSHKRRSRSRKPVESSSSSTHNHVKSLSLNIAASNTITTHQNPHHFDPRCLEWFSNRDGHLSNFEVNSNSVEVGGAINLNLTHSGGEMTRGFIDAWSSADRDGIGDKCSVSSKQQKLLLPPSSLTLSMSSADEIQEENNENVVQQMNCFRPPWMRSSPPGGPLAEALCLGIPSSHTTNVDTNDGLGLNLMEK